MYETFEDLHIIVWKYLQIFYLLNYYISTSVLSIISLLNVCSPASCRFVVLCCKLKKSVSKFPKYGKFRIVMLFQNVNIITNALHGS